MDLEVETTPQIEALRALERFTEELKRAETDPCDWKWAIIAGHNAIQNFMTSALDPATIDRSQVFSDRQLQIVWICGRSRRP